MLIVYLSIATILMHKKGKENFDKFYTSDIRGKLGYVTLGNGQQVFSIQEKREIYSFSPDISEINDYHDFKKIAKKGDSIIKPSNSDTLRLIKKGKIYLYTFTKF